jgi:purine-nucleoside/S-methyl-5'-thioadenosine phosphorylase / adenosine deaminase
MRSFSKTKSHSRREIQQIDERLREAGLVRNIRGQAAGVGRRVRLERAEPEELRRPAPAPRVAANGVQWLSVPAWEQRGQGRIPWLWHGFSTRRGGLSYCYRGENAMGQLNPGELNLGFTTEDEAETVAANRRLLVEAITGNPETPLVTLRQFHSNVVVIAGGTSGLPAAGPKADGMMTDEPGVLLGIQTADCIPVLLADRQRRVVAAFHAGWRGTVRRIVESGIGRLRLEFGSRPEDLTAAIGPGIGACCYSVGEEVLSEFESQFAYARELFHDVDSTDAVRKRYPMLFLTQRAPGHSALGPFLHLDLVEANRRQLLDAGLKARAIHIVGGCTNCQTEVFFSHRASRGHTGRMLSVIGIRAE